MLERPDLSTFTGTIVSLSLMFFGISARSFSLSCGIKTFVKCPPRWAASKLLFEPANRQYFTAQRDFACHGDIALDRNIGQGRHQRRTHADARTRTVLRRAHLPARECAHRPSGRSPHRPRGPSARLRTTVIAASIDSFMTSPSCPV